MTRFEIMLIIYLTLHIFLQLAIVGNLANIADAIRNQNQEGDDRK